MAEIFFVDALTNVAMLMIHIPFPKRNGLSMISIHLITEMHRGNLNDVQCHSVVTPADPHTHCGSRSINYSVNTTETTIPVRIEL